MVEKRTILGVAIFFTRKTRMIALDNHNKELEKKQKESYLYSNLVKL